MKHLINLGAFQATWFVTVASAASGRVWPSVAALTCSVALQSSRRVPVRLPGPGLLAGCAAIGYVGDSALWGLGWLSFPENAQIGWPVPAWMCLLWVNLATTLDGSLAWVGERPFVAAVLGALGGPLSYLSGEYFGVLSLGRQPGAALGVACLWALAFPSMALTAKSLRGSSGNSASPAADGGRS